MKAGPPPLRFLCLVIGGWICIRAAMLAADRPSDEPVAKPVPQAAAPTASVLVAGAAVPPSVPPALSLSADRRQRPFLRPPFRAPTRRPAILLARADANAPAPSFRPTRAERDKIAGPPSLPIAAASAGRWSAAAWAFLRRGDAPALASGGTLGGSQLGGRIAYRINGNPARPLALVARASMPLGETRAAEAALGIEWQPTSAPIRLLVERRLAIGDDGRSAFAVTIYGGVSDARLAGPVLLDAYGQAGLVGAHSRDLFADGAVAVTVPLDRDRRLKAGVGAWGAAQPGVSRLDVGPQLSVRLPLAATHARLTGEWRLRIAGDAAPASGPALTLAADF